MALIIDTSTGTIFESGDCYIVDADNLTESQQWYLEHGADIAEIADIARLEGVPLSRVWNEFRTNFIEELRRRASEEEPF